MAVKFSNDGQEVIKKTISTAGKRLPDDELWHYFEIDKCVDFIQLHQKVALQFPDHLLPDSVAIATILRGKCGKDVFILGDTSYGSCCIDEVAADHISCDAIIHFGPSCLSRTKRLPALYVFGREEIDIDDFESQFRSLYSDSDIPILILYDVTYVHAIESITGRLSTNYNRLAISSIQGQSYDSHETDKTRLFGRLLNTSSPITDYKVLYIGREGTTLTNFMLTLRENEFHSYNPQSHVMRHETASINKMLGRRYFLIQKAKEAMTVGILVGTLGIVNYLPMINRIKDVMRSVGKKFYTVAVGKINPAKLANLMEIDIYVLIACPESSLLQSQEFYKPIVTPFEMELACLSNRTWTGNITLDYTELLKTNVDIPEARDNEPDLSLITGRLINRTDNEFGSGTSTDIVLQNDNKEIIAQQHSGAKHLIGRTWQGLERKIGETEVVGVVEGLRGVATHYTHENDSEK